jgi:transposase
MDRTELATRLDAGRSIESIARELGRAPSTVAYWVNKYGLTSSHALRHAARGGLTREQLEPLVTAGLSIRAMAERLGTSYATVRHWLVRHELTTTRARRVAVTVEARKTGLISATLVRPRHGATKFRRRAEGGWRCLKCRSEAVSTRRRTVKAALVREAGGCCALCGYARSLAALHFHHVDRASKTFHLAHRGAARSITAARVEVAKCVLLCANCHAEVEAGVATLPASVAD